MYRVEIEDGSGAVVQSSSTSTSLLLDSSFFETAGSYCISVTAQYIAGDPLFRESDYYAVNEEDGASLYFEVE